MSIFGSSYPPGCGSVPGDDDPVISKESEWVIEALDEAGVPISVANEIIKLISGLEENANRECPECQNRAFRREVEDAEAAKVWKMTRNWK